MKAFSTIVLALCALGFLAFGMWLLTDPASALGKIGIRAESATGLVELRAFYGGMEIGLGLFLAACVAKPEWRGAGLWLVLLSNGGAGLARLIAIFLGGASVAGYLGWALLWELGFAAAATVSLYLHGR